MSAQNRNNHMPFGAAAQGDSQDDNLNWENTPNHQKTLTLSHHLRTVMLFLFDRFTKGGYAVGGNLSSLSALDGKGGITFHLAPCPFDEKSGEFLSDTIDTVLERDIEAFFLELQNIKKVEPLDSNISDVVIAPPQHYPSRVLYSDNMDGLFELFEKYMEKHGLNCLDQMAMKEFEVSDTGFHAPPGLSSDDFIMRVLYALPMKTYTSNHEAFCAGVSSFMQEPFPFSINQLRVLYAQSRQQDAPIHLVGYHMH